MPDVFISYTTADREHARRLATALERRGWTVWWDRTILPGSDWQAAIETALTNSRCAVVLWSQYSVESNWVRTEAEEARERGILVPACLDDARIPLAFRRIQAASLVGWTGKHSHAGFNALQEGISAVLARSVQSEGAEPATPVTETSASEPSAALQIPARHVIPRRIPKLPSLPAWLRSGRLQRWSAVVAALVGIALVAWSLGPLGRRLQRIVPLRLRLVTRIRTPKIANSISFSPDSRLIAAMAGESACAWNTESGAQVRCYPIASFGVIGVQWLDANLLLVSGISSSHAFEVGKASSDAVLSIPTSALYTSFSPDRTQLAFDRGAGSLRHHLLTLASSKDHVVETWSIPKRAVVCNLQVGPSEETIDSEWSPDGKRLATRTIPGPLSDDLLFLSLGTETTSMTKIWSTSTCQLVATSSRQVHVHNRKFFRQIETSCVDWRNSKDIPCSWRNMSPDGQYWTSGNEIRKASDSSIADHYDGRFLAWGPEVRQFYLAPTDNVVRLASIGSATPLRQVALPFGIRGSPAISPDRKVLAIGVYDRDASAYVWNAERGQITATVRGVQNTFGMRLEEHAPLLVISDFANGECRVFDTFSGAELPKMRGTNPAVSPNGRHLAAVPKSAEGAPNDLCVWKISRW